MKVENFISNSGNAVANQFIITDDVVRVFQSYDTVIARETTDYSVKVVELDKKYWDYSKTTGKYRNQFLGETKKETQAKIDSGEYKLTNLN